MLEFYGQLIKFIEVFTFSNNILFDSLYANVYCCILGLFMHILAHIGLANRFYLIALERVQFPLNSTSLSHQ